jgi:hypothetical protein
MLQKAKFLIEKHSAVQFEVDEVSKQFARLAASKFSPIYGGAGNSQHG